MEINEYQEFAISTAVYPNIGSNLIYPVLGLAGEVGELQEKMVKLIIESNYTLLDKDNKIPGKILTQMLDSYSKIGLEQNKLKKLIRDNEFKIKDYFRTIDQKILHHLNLESGDIKWYSALIDHELGITSERCCMDNQNKLMKRKKEGTIHGSGDEERHA